MSVNLSEATMPSTVSESDEIIRTSTVTRFVDRLLAEGEIDPRLAVALRSVREAVQERNSDGPFLSVLLRTQGQRIEPFKDALLCLAAQSSQDFEVIVIDHDADIAGAAAVREAIANQAESFRSRVRVLEVSGGNRGKPLNVGIKAARGQYVAVFDDDDLLFGNWVAEFKNVAATSQGRLLRSLVAVQTVLPETWRHREAGFRATSWPKAAYPRTFDQIAHFEVNYSPFMSWAFPSSVFGTYGLAFDEELTVCEDWDMILRGSTLCGVDQVDALTAVYRRWEGGVSSYTAHSRESWDWSEARVVRKLNESTLLLAPGATVAIRSLLSDKGARLELNYLANSSAWKLARPIRGAVRVARIARRIAGKIARRVRR
ncbi:glycosyltransferase [Cryobacterium serini]|uniref:Glycosyltransferase n=1 Tax=Cryobacterium serini TaxID=1259201 RepID=A0A4R9BLA3_9MICO|nr:glycosyltransferase [Cryobacterium serini]TFD86266.1 glycosyltransferase [Cryobacterium serini]